MDAHILVDPLISVSEGHYIAETARARLLTDSRVLDALIHVDPEDDMHVRSVANLPPRDDVAERLRNALAEHDVHVEAITLHYLSTGLEIQAVLAAADDARRVASVDLEALRVSLGASKLDVMQSLDAHGALATHDKPRETH